ncbi:hypothetical protein NLG97_g6992 [Lecanicillium saksenae]|uniref:Uncharacterized protein n=1 Tax=Lecanicillium saksenae TaxID=468837 RepID=A0ACC1QPC4_9HYPO|nr:hypothetical protein NLG97_g6992 [Lecanicillium saksenae]
MAPVPALPLLHTHVARQPDLQTWKEFIAENEQPTAAMCTTFLVVTLLVLGLLLYTGRRWEECNSSDSFRRRICVRCRDNASAQAARLRHCYDESMELIPRVPTKETKEVERPVTWHGSNMLNTSWGWMG